MTSTPASMGGPLSDADRLAEIQARLDAATEGPWEQGATLLLGEVMFTDDLRETTSDRATKCCYCTKCGPVLWEGMTELFDKTVKAHRHRSPTTPAAFADDMVMGANARIITSEVHKPADATLIANAPRDIAYLLARVGVLEGQLATARERLRELSKLQCQPTDTDDSELGWGDGYNAALAEVRHLAAELLPETVAERHRPQEVYLEFHEFPVQSSKRVICSECSGQLVPWDEVDEASLVLWPCPEAKALGLDGGGSDAE